VSDNKAVSDDKPSPDNNNNVSPMESSR